MASPDQYTTASTCDSPSSVEFHSFKLKSESRPDHQSAEMLKSPDKVSFKGNSVLVGSNLSKNIFANMLNLEENDSLIMKVLKR